MKILDLSYNELLTGKTYRLIALRFRRLTFLNLERNFIKDEGLKALVTPAIEDEDQVDLENESFNVSS